MAFTLENVVPWGRSYDEYVSMFNLKNPTGRILGCSDGPASFNTEATAKGIEVTSCDPIYAFTAEEIEARITATYPTIMRELEKNQDQYMWDRFKTPEDVGTARMGAMQRFLVDFPEGKAAGRYQAATLPELPYKDKTFDLALCSHFLFLYSEQFDLEFHIAAMQELCRVAKEVRVFPLVNLAAEPSPYIDAVVNTLLDRGYAVRLSSVGTQFQKGADKMMQVIVGNL